MHKKHKRSQIIKYLKSQQPLIENLFHFLLIDLLAFSSDSYLQPPEIVRIN